MSGNELMLFDLFLNSGYLATKSNLLKYMERHLLKAAFPGASQVSRILAFGNSLKITLHHSGEGWASFCFAVLPCVYSFTMNTYYEFPVKQEPR